MNDKRCHATKKNIQRKQVMRKSMITQRRGKASQGEVPHHLLNPSSVLVFAFPAVLVPDESALSLKYPADSHLVTYSFPALHCARMEGVRSVSETSQQPHTQKENHIVSGTWLLPDPADVQDIGLRECLPAGLR
ncbi:hypothetical protein E2C01_053341 [Portunus trituberculatus]|uniref:Uncharacterized protein n=1 Tax=Portunus trituberculatus TaxID=210409 RepID=A0A5B7GP37_PORTR|nr:hypothetical protein [Portunus trituberculatus]